MFILVGLCILIALALIILGSVKIKENYLVAGDLVLVLGMIINMARSYNSSVSVFISATVAALIVFGLVVIVIALNIRKKDMLINKRTGMWEKNCVASDIDYTVYECSVCGKWIYKNPSTSIFEIYKENKYCRNCGAKMKDKYGSEGGRNE